MELAENCEREIERIKATVDCPKGFRCCTHSKCARAIVYEGANLVQCQESDRMSCPITPPFCRGRDIVFCCCRLRRYLALKLNR